MKISKRLGRLGVDWRDSGGKRRWKSFKKPEDAQVFLGQLLIASGKKPTIEATITLAEYAPRWLSLVAVRVRPASLLAYRQRLDHHLLPAMGLIALRDFDRPMLRDWLAMKMGTGISRSLAGGLLFVLHSIFARAVQDGILPGNPTEGLSKELGLGRSRRRGEEEIRAMTAEQCSRFLAAVRQFYPAYHLDFVMLAMTGLRVGELYGTQWSDIDLDAKVLNVSRQFHHDGRIAPPKSPRARRSVDLGPDLIEMLKATRAKRIEEDLRAGRGETTWVMRPWVTVGLTESMHVRRMLTYVMRRALRKAKLPENFTPHSLRHTFATLHLARGESPKYVQEQLGHESIQITVDTYGRWFPTRSPKAAETLEDSILRNRTA